MHAIKKHHTDTKTFFLLLGVSPKTRRNRKNVCASKLCKPFHILERYTNTFIWLMHVMKYLYQKISEKISEINIGNRKRDA